MDIFFDGKPDALIAEDAFALGTHDLKFHREAPDNRVMVVAADFLYLVSDPTRVE